MEHTLKDILVGNVWFGKTLTISLSWPYSVHASVYVNKKDSQIYEPSQFVQDKWAKLFRTQSTTGSGCDVGGTRGADVMDNVSSIPFSYSN